jgi:glycosyltransferase involved in cell wall biosynthesis
MMLRKKAIVTVTNDLFTDQRADKVCRYLVRNGVDVLLVGRELPESNELNPRTYATCRMKLKFTKGALFYAEYNFRLFFFLLFRKFDFLVSNDLDTLPACDMAAACKGKEVVYDSHECFTEVPELSDKPIVRKIWEVFEIMIFKNRKRRMTVNKSIADYYDKKYKSKFLIVSNLPEKTSIEKTKSREDLGLPENKSILILQGAGINIQRGAEELCEAMRYLDDCFLVLIGSGDVFPQIKKTVSENEILKNRIKIVDKLPYEEMMQFTLNADIGFSLDKPVSLNYTFSLPNKIFDYIRAGLPMMVSDLPEIKKVVTEYTIGTVINEISPLHLSEEIKKMCSDKEKLNEYRTNCIKALNELNWERQEIVLDEVYKGLF